VTRDTPREAKNRSGDDAAPFSSELEQWLEQEGPKTIGSLTDVIEEKSLALVIMLLLFPSALPIPTGGVTHVLELAAALVALQMIVGRRELWLPRRFARHELGQTITGKAIPAIIRKVRWFERWSRPRFGRLIDTRLAQSLLGVFLLLFIAGALLAPPFSGLDTLPSIGVVVVCLGIIFSDIVIVALGLLAGTTGIALVIALGRAAWSLL
jgi:hypothetical protein